MILSVLIVFFDLFVGAFNIILIGRIIMSWMVADMHANRLGRLLIELTEPILAPVRKLIPSAGMLDLAPLVTVLGLYLLRAIILGVLVR